jgi:hypothetical protein
VGLLSAAWNPSLRWDLLGPREYIASPTARLLGQFDTGDIETIVRTLQAIADRATWEAAQE